MGTHCAMVVRDVNGKIKRYENTMDGYQIIPLFQEWVNEGDYTSPPDPNHLGTGHLEVNEDGEGEQEYSLVLDLKDKQFMVGWTIDKDTFEAMNTLVKRGWSFSEDPLLGQVLWDPSTQDLKIKI